MSVKRTLLASLCLLKAMSVSAEDDLFGVAASAASDGDFVLMQETYEHILKAEPKNVQALNGKAAAQAWRGNYYAAVETYRKTLVIEPKNLDALIGAGYAFAWAGDYQYASESFERALAVSPGNLEASKGSAYVALWSGDTDAARSQFAQLSQPGDDNADVMVALGQAHLQEGASRAALAAFDEALTLDPGRVDASAGRQAAFDTTPRLEGSAWYGSTTNAGSGLRLVELAWWAGRDTRLAVRYDDSLSIDNPAIARQGQSAETYLGGVQHRFGEKFTGVLEGGLRQLPDGDQTLVRAEMVLNNLPGKITLGAQVASHDLGYDDRLYYVGIGVPFAGRWQIESNNYLSQTGADSNQEWRSVLNVMYAGESGWDIVVGAGIGEVDRGGLQEPERVNVGHVMATLPVFGFHRLHFVVRHEDLPSDSVNVAMLGFTYRLPH